MEIVQFKRNVAYANNSKHVNNVQCHRVTQKGQDKKCKNHKRQKKEIFSSKLVSVDAIKVHLICLTIIDQILKFTYQFDPNDAG